MARENEKGEKMKLPTQKIENAVDKNDSRYQIRGAYLDVTSGELVVTNGHILVKHVVEIDEGDVSGIIPLEAIEYARKTKAARITTSATHTYVNGAAFPLVDGTYPDYERVIPKPSDVTVVLDLTLLEKIRRAMFEKATPNSACRVALHVTDPHNGVRVTPGDGGEEVAVIMPCRKS